MEIANNILKRMLQNVIFVIGTNCGGKTTTAKALAERNGRAFYSADEHYWDHRGLTDEKNQPNMNRPFIDWEEYFGRDPEKQAAWLLSCMEEEVPFILIDLLRLSERHKEGVIADVHAVPEILLKVSDPSRIVAMTADDATIRRDFFGREDKNPLLECIRKNTPDPEKATENVLETAVFVANEEKRRIGACGIHTDERTGATDFEKRLRRTESHLRIGGKD